MSDASGSKSVQSVQRTFRILDYLRQRDGGGVTEVANALEIAQSSVHAHLTTLKQAGFVTEADGVYYPGMKFLTFGGYVRNRKDAYMVARPIVEKVAEQSNERAQFGGYENGRAFVLFNHAGSDGVTPEITPLGLSTPMYASAAGKAILAQKSESAVDSYLTRTRLRPLTDQTITDPETFRQELAAVNEAGYATNVGESTEGVYSIAVAVSNAENEVLGALGVSGPSHRFRRDDVSAELPELLLGFANELEINIAHS